MRAARWTAEDDQRLEFWWGCAPPLGEIAQKLGRTERACYLRAQHLGLRGGIPVGFEGLTAAARKRGYDPRQLGRLLEAAGVAIRGTLANPDPAYKRREHMAETDQIDAALERWHATEPLEAVCRRLSVRRDPSTVRARLYQRGLLQPTRGKHARVTDAQVLAVLTPDEYAC